MKMKCVIGIIAVVCGLCFTAPQVQAQNSYGYGYGYGYSYPNYNSGHSRYYPPYYGRYPAPDYRYPKYKHRQPRQRKPDVSIGPRWDPEHGWVYF